MRQLSLPELLWLHDRLLQTSGGTPGVRDLGQIEAALAQPRASFDTADLYPDLLAKAAVLCFGLVRGHGFIDGNKRIGHAAMEMLLLLNGATLNADVDEQERVILAVADGSLSREAFERWVREHAVLQPGTG